MLKSAFFFFFIRHILNLAQAVLTQFTSFLAEKHLGKPQWILKPLFRYSVSKTSVVCLTILAPQTNKATLLASCTTLIDLQVMKTLYKMKNGFTEEWRYLTEEVERNFTCFCFIATLLALTAKKRRVAVAFF